MNASELKFKVEETGKSPHFFDRKTMKFWSDTMKNYGVRRVMVQSNFDQHGEYHHQGVLREVFELYRKRAVKHGVKDSAYFDAVTFSRVHVMR